MDNFDTVDRFEEKSNRDYIAMILLCFFVGYLGIHRFYAGKIFTGILMLLTGGGFGIWVLIDFIFIVTGKFKDVDERYITHN